jgi:diketogulonate reductase-like aldo/keto reductase
MKKSGIRRSELFFTTKVPPGQIEYQKAKDHIDNTLKITKLDYVDLYLLHAPFGGKVGRLGAWKALVEGVEAGKIRSIGVSNYGVHHLDELEEYIKETNAKDGAGKGGVLSVNQVELHPWLPRKDIVGWCEKRNVLLEVNHNIMRLKLKLTCYQAYCPLVRAIKNDDPLLVPIAKAHSKTTAQVLLRWSVQKGFVPLPKSVTKSRIEENANIYDFELTDNEMESLDLDVYEPCAWDPTTSTD